MRGPLFFAKAAGHQAQTLQIRCMFLQTPYGVMKHSEPNRPYSQITEDCDGSTFRRQIPRGDVTSGRTAGRPMWLRRIRS